VLRASKLFADTTVSFMHFRAYHRVAADLTVRLGRYLDVEITLVHDRRAVMPRLSLTVAMRLGRRVVECSRRSSWT
jgi:hypothetical protein